VRIIEPETETDAGAPAPPSVDPASPEELTRRFLALANGDEDAGAQALSTPECWSKECRSFASQAGKKFQARESAPPRAAGSRAVADADVICPGERKCDFVHLLLLRTELGWRVADVIEDDLKAADWLR